MSEQTAFDLAHLMTGPRREYALAVLEELTGGERVDPYEWIDRLTLLQLHDIRLLMGAHVYRDKVPTLYNDQN